MNEHGIRPMAMPTEYDGIPFRSRLEAKYARALELTGADYLYEPEVFDLGDGLMYTPDFYLPGSGIWLEVKGEATRADREKIRRFSVGHRLVVGFQDRLVAVNFPGRDADDNPVVLRKAAFRRNPRGWLFSSWQEGGPEPSMDSPDLHLIRCPECGEVQFLSDWGRWSCQSCGYYDGDSILGHAPLGDDLLRIVNGLDMNPYRRQPRRACMNCAKARCSRGSQSHPYGCSAFPSRRCGIEALEGNAAWCAEFAPVVCRGVSG